MCERDARSFNKSVSRLVSQQTRPAIINGSKIRRIMFPNGQSIYHTSKPPQYMGPGAEPIHIKYAGRAAERALGPRRTEHEEDEKPMTTKTQDLSARIVTPLSRCWLLFLLFALWSCWAAFSGCCCVLGSSESFAKRCDVSLIQPETLRGSGSRQL